MKFNSCEPQRCFIHLVFLWVNGFRHFCGLFIHFYRAVDVMINEFAVVACTFDLNNKNVLFYLSHTQPKAISISCNRCGRSVGTVRTWCSTCDSVSVDLWSRGDRRRWQKQFSAFWRKDFRCRKQPGSTTFLTQRYVIETPFATLHNWIIHKFQFVLYANRVHNMLGPSMDGGTDLRPKGRGRPQRILLGIWPDEHIKAVIKSVVFRDEKIIKEDPMIYGRQSVSSNRHLHVSQRDP